MFAFESPSVRWRSDRKSLFPERSRAGASALGSAEPLSAAVSRGARLHGMGAAHSSSAFGPQSPPLCRTQVTARFFTARLSL